MKNSVILLLVLALFSGCGTANRPNTNDQSDRIGQRVDSVLALMNLTEKVGQLNLYNGTWEFTGPVPEDDNNQLKAENIKQGKVGGMLNVLSAEATREAQRLAVENSRLGIPLIFGYDVVHGYKTMFPIPLGQAAGWDADAARLGSKIAAKESAAAGLHWTFAPMIDVSRDARWGRIMESAGEDPYLASVMARAWIEGYQGNDLSDFQTIAACAKHFAAYGFAEAGRDYNTVDISNHTLYNVVLPPFKAASEAGVATFMNAFNEIGGIPANGSSVLQRDILKGEWGFEGFIVSDWASINELIMHGFAEDEKEAARIALTTGSDMDMEARIYERELEKLVSSGEVDMVWLDDAVRRILRIKFMLGLFDNPYGYSDTTREQANILTPENLEAAREVGRKSIVLLKNESGLLPLKKSGQSIAVIGQLANSKDVPLGSWRAQAVANTAVSLLEGVEEASDSQVKFAQGYTLTTGSRDFVHELNIVEGDKSGFAAAIQLAKTSDVVVIALGEDCFQTGEGRSQADITLKGNQEDLLKEIVKVNKNVVAVLMNGRPLAIPYVVANVPAIVESWHLGSEAGHAIADVLFGDYNPTGKLPVSFPYHVGQEPLYYNKKNTGRPVAYSFDAGLVFWSHYTDNPTEALLPFGYGLSYAAFEYKGISAEKNTEGAKVTVDLTNTAAIDGTETVQLYIRDLVASETQPIKRLVAFQKVEIKAGQSAQVSFQLTEKDLGFVHSADRSFYAEDGRFLIMAGGNSRDLLQTEIELDFAK